MHSFEKLLEIVSDTIARDSLSKEPNGLYAPVTYVLDMGGKRIRPVLALTACEMFGGDVEEALYPAIGLEVFHNFTLLHDDVMDKADMRRNKPTVHKKWNENTAILSGDAMQILAFQYICRCPEAVLKPVLDVFSQTALEVCEGQQYDMEFEDRQNVTVEEYMRMIELKTSVLLAGSLKVGALIGGASNEEANHLYQFGRNIGLAFQLKDDWLDCFGDEAVFGKKIGGDILNNKKTYLLIEAMRLAEGKNKEILHDWIQKEDYEPQEKIAAVKELYLQLGVKERSEILMEEYYAKALDYLSKTSGDPEIKASLEKFARKLIHREK